MPQNMKLKNQKEIQILETLSNYLTHEIQYLIQTEEGNRSILSREQLENLLPKSEFTKQEKLNIFLDYFNGRKDVYAKRWMSGERKGYTPHCANEWTNLCPKKIYNNPKYDCSKCKIRSLIPYDKTVVEKQLKGNQREFFGIYPMLEDDSTYFIVLDFDKENAVAEAKAVFCSAKKYNITMLIEKSQSGKGIHLWLFFEQNLPAYLARKLGELLLLDATNHNQEINFTSYDRMIPMQDTLPKGSFGNLIALPLKWENVKDGRSTFLDEGFQTVPERYLWQHLSSIPKYSLTEVNKRIELLEKENPVNEYQEDIVKTTNKKNYPRKISVQKAGELIISKEGLSRKEQIALMYLATFKNLEYYKKQAMRTSTWDTPRLITSAREDVQNIYLPRGLEVTLSKLISKLEISDIQTQGMEISLSFNGELRQEQQDAMVAILNHDIGIIQARTAFGKTVLAAKSIAHRKKSTLVLVQNQNLAQQWKKQLLNFLDIQTEAFVEYTPTGRKRKKEKVGIVSGTSSQQTKVIDIAMFQKLSRLNDEELAEFLSDYGYIIIDECHHIAAKTFERVIKKSPAKYILGLSATPQREDGLTPITKMCLGSVIFESEKFSQENLLLRSYLYPRYTSIGELDKSFENETYPEQLNFLSNSKERNRQIVEDINENYNQKRAILVLSERVEHLETLRELLTQETIYLLTGSNSKKENQKIIEQLAKEQAPFILLATSKLVGEGFDLPQLDTLFLTLPFKAKGNHKQYLGRLQRNLSEKDELKVYDYVDISSGLFANMYQKRLKTYKEMEYQVAEDEATRKYQARLFDETDYEPFFKEELMQAKNEIIIKISIPSKRLCQLIKKARSTGVEVSIYCMSMASLNEHLKNYQELMIEELMQAGIEVFELERISQQLVLIDGQKCWYGDLNFLGTKKKYGSVLRFDSEKVVGEFLNGLSANNNFK